MLNQWGCRWDPIFLARHHTRKRAENGSNERINMEQISRAHRQVSPAEDNSGGSLVTCTMRSNLGKKTVWSLHWEDIICTCSSSIKLLRLCFALCFGFIEAKPLSISLSGVLLSLFVTVKLTVLFLSPWTSFFVPALNHCAEFPKREISLWYLTLSWVLPHPTINCFKGDVE